MDALVTASVWLQKNWGDFQTYGGDGFCNVDEHSHRLFSTGRSMQNAAEASCVRSCIGYRYTS